MDEVTSAVRAMYELFPYPPAGAPMHRVGTHVRLALSLGQRRPPPGRVLRVLDAGCGRGIGLLGSATLQPDVLFDGVDLNRVALADLERELAARGLKNVRTAEVNLMTMAGLTPPEGGYDGIHSSGVLHHLSDPLQGLQALKRVLAPHGVMTVMVYGLFGREPLYRLVDAINRVVPDTLSLEERLLAARQMVRQLAMPAVRTGPWSDLDSLRDAEFVDRYLNVNEVAWSVEELFDLLDQAGMRFLRWCEPADWSLPPNSSFSSLPPMVQYQLVERLQWRHRLEFYATHADNAPREALSRDALADAVVAVNPEVAFRVESRMLHGHTRTERLLYQLRNQEPVSMTGGLAQAAGLLQGQNAPFLVHKFCKMLPGVAEPMALVDDLLRREILYVV